MIHKDKKQKGFRAVSSSRRYFYIKVYYRCLLFKKMQDNELFCVFLKLHTLHEEHNLRLFAQIKLTFV